jgi:ketosteroid isomerase-like protein
MPTVSEIAKDLVKHCGKGEFAAVLDKHYSDDIVSIEPVAGPNMPAKQEGIAAIRAKNEWWVENHEIHSANVDGPFVGEDQFAVRFKFDVTFKPTGQRTEMTEMALYTVKDGKIVQEEFFYNMPGS